MLAASLAIAKPAFNHYISVGGQLLGRQVWQLSMSHVGPAGQMLSCRSHVKHTQLSDAPPKAALLTPTYTRVPNMQMHTTSYQTLLLLGCKACTAPVSWPASSFCPHSPTIQDPVPLSTSPLPTTFPRPLPPSRPKLPIQTYLQHV